MIEKVLIFFVFLGPLIFFHELGHFFFARLFGVKVEVFSIGFGPKLFTFKRGDTQYAFSLIPLGGYVKMFGDDPTSEVEFTPEEAAVAYTRKGKLARFFIVFGGPLANFILAFFIYLSIISFGEKIPQTKFGVIQKEHVFYQSGIRTGDILVNINAQEITSFDDLNFVDSNVETLTINRNEQNHVLHYQAPGMKFLEEFSKVASPLRAPILVDKLGNHYLVKKSQGKILSLEEILEFKGNSLELISLKEEVSFEFHAEKINLDGFEKKNIVINGDSWKKIFIDEGLYPKDLYIKKIVKESAAEKANMKSGEIITSVGGEKIYHFSTLKKRIQELNGEKPVDISVLGSNGVRKLNVTPTYREHNGTKYLSVGVESGVSFYSFMVTLESKGFINSIQKAYKRTYEGSVKTLLGFKKLVTGEVSLKNVGGPIAIGQVASDSFNISLTMFFRLMAIISINLGIINLFPIPVLDGGHIVFIALEALNRGPLSRKKMLIAQQIGMSMLFLLIFVAFFNDISRLF